VLLAFENISFLYEFMFRPAIKPPDHRMDNFGGLAVCSMQIHDFAPPLRSEFAFSS
jgi:hypothetical protein